MFQTAIIYTPTYISFLTVPLGSSSRDSYNSGAEFAQELALHKLFKAIIPLREGRYSASFLVHFNRAWEEKAVPGKSGWCTFQELCDSTEIPRLRDTIFNGKRMHGCWHQYWLAGTV